MKKVNDVLQEYFAVIREVDLEMFEESFTGTDPYYAKKVMKKLESIFGSRYGMGRTGTDDREYLFKPTVLSSKKAGIAVAGITMCKLDYRKGLSRKEAFSVVRFLVPERYQKNERWRDYLSWADYVNGGKICYYPEVSARAAQERNDMVSGDGQIVEDRCPFSMTKQG